MDELEVIRERLGRTLKESVAADPLGALSAIGGIQRDLEADEREAVRAAIQGHSWAEIGAALGISKQAAHQRLAKAWASQLRDEIKAANRAHKAALREGSPEEGAAAVARRNALLDEFKRANRRKKAA
jgi:hypothetical protein